MPTFQINQSLLDTSLDNQATLLTMTERINPIIADMTQLFALEFGFDSDFVESNNGLALTYKTPTFYGENGNFKFLGSITANYLEDGSLKSFGGALTGATVKVDDGTMNLVGSIKAQ